MPKAVNTLLTIRGRMSPFCPLIFAIIVGVLLAGAPLLAFDFWLDGLIDRQGQDEVDTSAKRAIGLAEFRVTQVIAALDGLAARGVDSCGPDDIEAMR